MFKARVVGKSARPGPWHIGGLAKAGRRVWISSSCSCDCETNDGVSVKTTEDSLRLLILPWSLIRAASCHTHDAKSHATLRCQRQKPLKARFRYALRPLNKPPLARLKGADVYACEGCAVVEEFQTMGKQVLLHRREVFSVWLGKLIRSWAISRVTQSLDLLDIWILNTCAVWYGGFAPDIVTREWYRSEDGFEVWPA